MSANSSGNQADTSRFNCDVANCKKTYKFAKAKKN